MPRRSDNRNPLVVNSGNEFSEVGYLTGGTPMPVNIIAGVITGANPTDGTLSQLGTLALVRYQGTLGTVNVVENVGTLFALDHGTVNIGGGTVNITGALTGANPTDGTLSQLGTLFHVETVKQIGTLPDVNINHGTIGISEGTVLARIEYGTIGVNMGTLQTITQIGTLPIPTTLLQGTRSTTAGVPVPLTASSTPIKNSVLIQADYANSGTILLGNATAQPVKLTAGESVVVVIDDAGKVYVDVTVSSESVNWVGS